MNGLYVEEYNCITFTKMKTTTPKKKQYNCFNKREICPL